MVCFHRFHREFVETTHDDIQYSPGGERLDDGIFVSVASAKLLLTTRHFIPNRLYRTYEVVPDDRNIPLSQ